MAIAHVYRHLVLMNDNFILLLICSGQEWQFHIVCHISWSRMALLSWHTYENIHFLRKPRHVMPQMDCLEKTSPVVRISTHIYGVFEEIDWKMFIFRVNLDMWPLKLIVSEKWALLWWFKHTFLGFLRR